MRTDEWTRKLMLDIKILRKALTDVRDRNKQRLGYTDTITHGICRRALSATGAAHVALKEYPDETV